MQLLTAMMEHIFPLLYAHFKSRFNTRRRFCGAETPERRTESEKMGILQPLTRSTKCEEKDGDLRTVLGQVYLCEQGILITETQLWWDSTTICLGAEAYVTLACSCCP